jgi:hypothetical protein
VNGVAAFKSPEHADRLDFTGATWVLETETGKARYYSSLFYLLSLTVPNSQMGIYRSRAIPRVRCADRDRLPKIPDNSATVALSRWPLVLTLWHACARRT